MMLLRIQDRLSVLEQTAILPAGIIAWCATTVPDGWLVCDGSVISASRYGQLVARLGGTTLPDLRGRVVVGKAASGAFVTLLGTGGAALVTLTSAQSGMPAHEHTYQIPSVIASGSTPNNINAGGFTGATTTGGAGQNASQAHENMPPYIVLLPIIKF